VTDIFPVGGLYRKCFIISYLQMRIPGLMPNFQKSTSYLSNIHFVNKKIHEMNNFFHEMDFSVVEVPGYSLLGVLNPVLESSFLR